MALSGDHDAEQPFIATTSKGVETLPPQDRGPRAWKALICVWLLEAIVWGFQLMFGVFQAYYEQHPLFRDSRAISSIGLCGAAMTHLTAPLVTAICLRFPKYQWYMACAGFLSCLASLVLASFATKAWHLVLTQGVLFGITFELLIMPCLIMLNQWFDKRLGLAYGIAFSASGITGLALPFIFEGLLHKTGFRVTLRLFVIASLIICGPGLLVMSQRKIAEPKSVIPKQIPPSLKGVPFQIFLVACFLHSLGFLIPRFFMPEYAEALNLKHSQADLLVAVQALAQMIGQIGLGHLSDHVQIHLPVSLAAGVPAASVFFLWGSAKSLAPLTTFSLVYVSFGAAFSVLWGRIATYLTSDASTAMNIFSLLSFVRGLAYLVAGPIGAGLLSKDVDITQYGLGRYKGIVIFVGIAMSLSALSGLGYLRRKEVAKRRLQEEMSRTAHEHKVENSIDENVNGSSHEMDPFITATAGDGERSASEESERPRNDK